MRLRRLDLLPAGQRQQHRVVCRPHKGPRHAGGDYPPGPGVAPLYEVPRAHPLDGPRAPIPMRTGVPATKQAALLHSAPSVATSAEPASVPAAAAPSALPPSPAAPTVATAATTPT